MEKNCELNNIKKVPEGKKQNASGNHIKTILLYKRNKLKTLIFFKLYKLYKSRNGRKWITNQEKRKIAAFNVIELLHRKWIKGRKNPPSITDL